MNTHLKKVGLATKNRQSGSTGRWGSLAALPGISVSLLPVGFCPACWPAYAGLLGSLGLGFLLKNTYLMPLTSIFLFIAVASLFYKAKTRKGYGPFILGLAASAIVLAGKFLFESDTAMYGGIAVLVSASLWNAWPMMNIGAGKGACPACAADAGSSHCKTEDVSIEDKGKEVNTMNATRKIEVFSAGCPVCEETIQVVNGSSCPSCEVIVLDMKDAQVARRAKDLGIRSVPAVVIDGTLADCCAGRGPDEATLRAGGLG